jgi:glycosyltransferase involved in cell wall biosynthesis
MFDRPEVSVVIPTRDRWPLLSAHAVPSALSQEDVDLELVVVDDGSTDGTSQKLDEWQDSRLRVLRHDRSRGVAGARNAGIAVARGSWIAFLDDDDLWSPQKLRTQLDAAQSAEADLVYAAAVLVDEHMSVLGADVFPPERELIPLLLEGNVIPGGCSNVLARAGLIREVGCFDERLTYTEDWDLWIRLALSGKATACPETLVAHVDHRGNALLRYRPDVLTEVDYVLTKHNPDIDLSTIRARRVDALEWMAHEFHRAGYRRKAARLYIQIARERRGLRDLLRAVVMLSGTRGEASARMLKRALPGGSGEGDVHLPPVPEWLEQYRDPVARPESA